MAAGLAAGGNCRKVSAAESETSDHGLFGRAKARLKCTEYGIHLQSCRKEYEAGKIERDFTKQAPEFA